MGDILSTELSLVPLSVLLSVGPSVVFTAD